MFSVLHKGDFGKTNSFLRRGIGRTYANNLDQYGQRGVDALRSATPQESGETADSWHYDIDKTKSGFSITWRNDVMADEAPLVILLQYGHGTRNGGYVQGQDFINPALKPIFDSIAEEAWASLNR